MFDLTDILKVDKIPFAGDASYSSLEPTNLIQENLFNPSAQLSLSSSSSFELEPISALSYSNQDAIAQEHIAQVQEEDPLTGIAANEVIVGKRPKEPDLVIENASVSPTVAVGDRLTLTYTLKNQGEATADPLFWMTSKLYLSEDATLSSDDPLLTTDYLFSDLAPGDSLSRSQSIELHSPGTYYLLYLADAGNHVSESNESNNLAFRPITTKVHSAVSGYGLVNAAAAVAKTLGQKTFADVGDRRGNYWGADLVKAPEVWRKGYTGQGVVVAVLDTGVDRKHRDLNQNIWRNPGEVAGDGVDNDRNGYIDDVYGWNFAHNNNNTLDRNSHGTHVSGTIAGENNRFGVTGIAYNAKIMAVKVLDDSGRGSWISVARGIRYAVDNGANVINLSLGGASGHPILESAVKYASSKGAIVVMAAGNEGAPAPGYPAGYARDWGLAVGAVDRNKRMAYFSNRAGTGSITYVTAPGVQVYSTVPNNRYASYSGTSMATPHVSGVVALMLSARHSLTDAQVRHILRG